MTQRKRSARYKGRMTSLTFPFYFIAFRPPLLGLEGEFNTFRLGRRWSERVQVGDVVLLTDERNCQALGLAEVRYVACGPLSEACKHYGYLNHTQLALPRRGAPKRILEIVQKIYGPHIATLTRPTTVIGLKRTC